MKVFILDAKLTRVLEMTGNGYTSIEIAKKLKTSVRTIDRRRKELLRITGAKTSAHLIKIAMRNKWIK